MYGKQSVVYANVWEDPELNRRSLHVNESDVVLSITSGGCNSLNLLLDNPQKVISIDCNPGQVALLDLKIAAFQQLSYEEICELFGVHVFNSEETPGLEEKRLVLYGRLREALPERARSFWDKNLNTLKPGLVHCGAVEKFFSMYRKVVRTLYKLDGADRLFFCKSLEEQREMYRKIFKNRVRLLNQLLLNKFVLGAVKGKHSFKYVNNLNFGRNFNLKLRHAFNNTLLYENYFLSLIFLGAYTARDQVQPYLKPENYEIIRKNVSRLENRLSTLDGVLKEYGPSSISKFNLSNIFEWFDEKTFNGIFSQALDLAKPSARLCYRYTLARPQSFDEANRQRLQGEPELAHELHQQDRAFMYESFHVYQVSG